jgi:hypothetical protein
MSMIQRTTIKRVCTHFAQVLFILPLVFLKLCARPCLGIGHTYVYISSHAMRIYGPEIDSRASSWSLIWHALVIMHVATDAIEQ